MVSQSGMKGFIKNIILYNYHNLLPEHDEILIEYVNDEIKKNELYDDTGNIEKFKVIKNGREFEVEINHNFNAKLLNSIGHLKKRSIAEIFENYKDMGNNVSA